MTRVRAIGGPKDDQMIDTYMCGNRPQRIIRVVGFSGQSVDYLSVHWYPGETSYKVHLYELMTWVDVDLRKEDQLIYRYVWIGEE